MNLSSFSGFIVAGLVLYFGVFKSTAKPEIFLDPHALILVIGGTLTAALISFPMKKLFTLAMRFINVVLLNKKPRNKDIAQSMVEAAAASRTNPMALANMRGPHAFLSEGFHMIADGILRDDELEAVLRDRSAYFKANYNSDAKVFQALAKFPPAFGLLGAVTGMIAMMGNLGASGGGAEKVGSSMAIALVATFWGIAVANLLFLPLAEYYMKLADEDSFQRKMIVEGLVLIKRRASPVVVAEKVNSFLPLEDRLSTQGTMSSGGRKAA